MNSKALKRIFLGILLGLSSLMANEKPCELNGFKLYGRVEFVDAFPDLRIEYVTVFSDIDVEFVSAFADSCGKWEEVDSFPDLKVQVVTSFADLKVRKVTVFPGMR